MSGVGVSTGSAVARLAALAGLSLLMLVAVAPARSASLLSETTWGGAASEDARGGVTVAGSDDPFILRLSADGRGLDADT
jgi:hypothetical protein